jgi:hypothetical protein
VMEQNGYLPQREMLSNPRDLLVGRYAIFEHQLDWPRSMPKDGLLSDIDLELSLNLGDGRGQAAAA